MSINFISGQGKKCQWCDKEAQYEVIYSEHPHVDRYCASSGDRLFCGTAKEQPAQPETE